MGSIRTWSLALIAGIFVVVVAHQRSNADAGRGKCGRGRTPAWPSARSPGRRQRVAGLPDFSGLVAENGAAVVNISVVEKPQKNGGNFGDDDSDDPMSQFFRHYQMPGPDHMPPDDMASVRGSSSLPTATCSPMRMWWPMPRK